MNDDMFISVKCKQDCCDSEMTVVKEEYNCVENFNTHTYYCESCDIEVEVKVSNVSVYYKVDSEVHSDDDDDDDFEDLIDSCNVVSNN